MNFKCKEIREEKKTKYQNYKILKKRILPTLILLTTTATIKNRMREKEEKKIRKNQQQQQIDGLRTTHGIVVSRRECHNTAPAAN